MRQYNTVQIFEVGLFFFKQWLFYKQTMKDESRSVSGWPVGWSLTNWNASMRLRCMYRFHFHVFVHMCVCVTFLFSGDQTADPYLGHAVCLPAQHSERRTGEHLPRLQRRWGKLTLLLLLLSVLLAPVRTLTPTSQAHFFSRGTRWGEELGMG